MIVKCVGSGVEPIFERLSTLWQARAQLDFRVSEPISIVSMARLFVQSRLDGSPVDVANQDLLIETAGQMASAVGSLHRSSVKWPEQFTVFDQLQRSERYLKEIEERFPSLSNQTGEIRQKLGDRAKTFAAANRAAKPIHGSLHLHQWLLDRGGLSLVDFDRACMGDVELDLATFVAQWDYEAQPLRGAVIRAFMKAYAETGQAFDIDLFSYYRAHKHLSKAYKAVKGASAGTVPGKLAKRLSNTQRMLDQPQALV